MISTSSASRSHGFSLIELLVAISIIALLIGILLPVLALARATARDAVCLSNMKQIGNGLGNYAANHNRYYPGPNTSGRSFNANASPTSPTMKGDWYSPMFGDDLGLSSNRNERLLQIFGEEFRCASNDKFYDFIYPSGAGWPDASTIPYNSYSMPSGFSYYYNADHATRMGDSRGRRFGRTEDQAVNTVPARNTFKTTTIGAPSMKVFALDGARYLTFSSGEVSFNTDGGTNFGDNFSTRGPVLNATFNNNGNPYKARRVGGQFRVHGVARDITYRHGPRSNPAVNAVYFDGHAELLSDADSRDVDKFFPTGSVVRQASLLADPDVRDGDVIR